MEVLEWDAVGLEFPSQTKDTLGTQLFSADFQLLSLSQDSVLSIQELLPRRHQTVSYVPSMPPSFMTYGLSDSDSLLVLSGASNIAR